MSANDVVNKAIGHWNSYNYRSGRYRYIRTQ